MTAKEAMELTVASRVTATVPDGELTLTAALAAVKRRAAAGCDRVAFDARSLPVAVEAELRRLGYTTTSETGDYLTVTWQQPRRY